MPDTIHLATDPRKSGDVKAVDAKAKSANRYASSLTPQMRQRITDECRVRGCVQTAKEYGVTVGLCLELRIADIDRRLSAYRLEKAA